MIIIGGVLFYFFIQKESKIENYDEKDLVDFKTREEIIKELEAFKKPSKEVTIPNNSNLIDSTVKTEKEIKTEIDSFTIPKEELPNRKSDEDILKLLSQ
ncbi:MAG: hypothetical protein KBD14_01700 [Candidatus Pacebacteria bacterium]|nr:hypothetical protein [Candidatus Paceibacterota bacterium]